MANVVGFNRIGDEGKFDIKICTNDVCQIKEGYYKLTNDKPGEQLFPFPATSDNKNVFVPERVVEDSSAFDAFVLSKFLTKPECITIEPCNVYTKSMCCMNTNKQTTKEAATSNSSMTGFMVVAIVLAVALFVLLIGAMIYVASTDGSGSSSNSGSLRSPYGYSTSKYNSSIYSKYGL